ncbi:MAG: LamG-like jellyroll fold domain-containing protein [Candidatus Nanoarchaeia archaeon]
MYKRGISAIIATVLILLIMIVAITLIWVAILPMIRNSSGFERDADLTINIQKGYTFYDMDKNFAFVHIRRGQDDSDLEKLRIIFHIEGKTTTLETNTAPDVNEALATSFNFTYFKISGVPERVGVAPVYKGGRIGDVVHEVDMPVKEGMLTEQEWEESDEQSRQYNPAGKITYWYDKDGDRYGNGSYLFKESSPGGGWYERDELIANTDCDDDVDKCGDDCNPGKEVETSCSDGYDNDCDGYVDCADMDCFTSECGLISYWQFDEASWDGTAGEVNDATGRNNGTAMEGLNTTSNGYINRAGYFDGVGYISLGNGAAIHDWDYFTLATWVKLEQGVELDDEVIYSCINEDNSDNHLILKIFDDGVDITISWYEDWLGGSIGTASVSGGEDVDDGKWHYIVLVRADNELRLYIDGDEVGKQEEGITAPVGNMQVRIGNLATKLQESDGGADFLFNGYIDEMMIFDRAFQDEEIEGMYNE